MPNVRTDQGYSVKLASLATPIFAFMVIVAAILFAASYKYDSFGGSLSAWFNARSDKFYSASFTLLTTFWGASLTVWGLLKSRTTRYIEKLHDNVVFIRFVRQYERRLFYSFAILFASFAIYTQDLKLGQAIDADTVVIAVWLFMYLSAMAALMDVLITAKEVL